MNRNKVIKSLDMKQMDILEKYLSDNNVIYERKRLYQKSLNNVCKYYYGEQIIVYSDTRHNIREWDAVCHRFSYGGDKGLLEIMGTIVDEKSVGDSVEGYLTAQDVIERIEKHERCDREL